MTSMAPAGLGQRRAFQSTPTSHISAPALRGLTAKSTTELPQLLRSTRCNAHSTGPQQSTIHRRHQQHPRRQPRGTVITRTFADPVMDAPDAEDEEDRPKWDPSKLTAVVVGAGPTGALTAHYLAMRGYRVEVGRQLRPVDSSSLYRRTYVTDRSGAASHTAKVKDFAVVRPVVEEGGYVGVWGLPARGLAAEPLIGFYTHKPQDYVYEWAAPGKPSVRLYIDVGGEVAGSVSGLGDADLSGGASGVASGLVAAYPAFPPEWAAAIGEQPYISLSLVLNPAPPYRNLASGACAQFYGPRTVLLGDAAHGVTGALGPVGLTGQGASAAIESVRTLALVLRGAQDDMDKVPEVYSNVRGDAVMAMQMMEFNELKNQADAGLRKLKFESWWYEWSSKITQGFFALAAAVGSLLAALVPGRFMNAGQVLSKLEDRRIGYSEVIRMLQGYAAPVVMAVFGGVFIGIFLAFASRLA
eukprot:XP_001699538.1 predicted protein [Chlamydomonas reinhardtii]